MSNDTLDQPYKANGDITVKDNAIKFGIIGGLAGILVSLILYFTGMQFVSWAKWIQTIVMIVVIILGIKSIADSHPNRQIPFGSLFKGGMIITLIISFITIIYFLIYMNFIELDFVNKVLEESRKQMAEKGLSEEQIDRALEMSKSFMSPGIMVAFSFIGSLIFGTITSLIGAGIFKKEK